jgi:trehalose utilization protein
MVVHPYQEREMSEPMITWREEGEREAIAMLGEIPAGKVWWYNPGHWGVVCYLNADLTRFVSTLPTAKAALEEAVAVWCSRAGLVPASER